MKILHELLIMSAYALPGTLFSSFPRLSLSLSSSSTTSQSSSTSQENKESITKSISTPQSSSLDNYYQTPLLSTISHDSVDAQNNNNNNNDDGNHSLTANNSPNFFVSVLSAAVDPMRLIQSYATRQIVGWSDSSVDIDDDDEGEITNDTKSFSNDDNVMNHNYIGNNYVDVDEQWGEYCDIESDDDGNTSSSSGGGYDTIRYKKETLSTSSTSSFEQQQQHQQKQQLDPERHPYHHPTSQKKSSSTDHHNFAQSDAIQFTLSLELNGRKYTAKRSLQQFMNLRKELIFELNKYYNIGNDNCTSVSFSSRKRGGGTSSSSLTGSHHHRRRHHHHHYNNNSIINNKRTKQGQHDNKKQNHEQQQGRQERIIIPELPPIGNNHKNIIINGFTGLQVAVAKACPLMEWWLRSIAKLVPFSSSLDSFLWEPLHKNNNDGSDDESMNSSKIVRSEPSSSPVRKINSKSSKSKISTCTLNSINESYDDDDEEEEEEGN